MKYPIEFERHYELNSWWSANPYEPDPKWIIEVHCHTDPARIKEHELAVARCKEARYQEWLYKNYP